MSVREKVIDAAKLYAEACADQEAMRRVANTPHNRALWSESCQVTQERLSDLIKAARTLETRPTGPGDKP